MVCKGKCSKTLRHVYWTQYRYVQNQRHLTSPSNSCLLLTTIRWATKSCVVNLSRNIPTLIAFRYRTTALIPSIKIAISILWLQCLSLYSQSTQSNSAVLLRSKLIWLNDAPMPRSMSSFCVCLGTLVRLKCTDRTCRSNLQAILTHLRLSTNLRGISDSPTDLQQVHILLGIPQSKMEPHHLPSAVQEMPLRT